MIKIDLVCPVYKNVTEIKRFLTSLSSQQNIVISNAVFPHTLCGNDNIDDEIESMVSSYKTFKINKEDFSHSLTREKAILEYCTENIVLLASQDVVFEDETSIYNLVSKIDSEIIYAYGRQVCKNNSIEKYIREKNYGSKDIVVDSTMIQEMQLMAFFASDAFSAINRNKFIELGGYRKYDVMMNEDQLFSKFLLDAGYKKMYCSNAVVEHSHKYNLKQLYNRYYETGKFYKEIKVFDEYELTGSGISLAFYILKAALIHFNLPVLFRWLPDMVARYLGMRKGKRRVSNL